MATTQTEQDNMAHVQRGFEAFAAGDMATLKELFHPDAVWHAATVGVIQGTYHGRDAILASFGELHRETAGTFTSKPIAMAATGERVFVQAHVGGERGGRSSHWSEVIVFTLGAGKVHEVHLYHGDYPVAAAFFA
jgi:uncharacterized protein